LSPEQVIADHYQGKPGVVAVYLFGSVARGTARTDSDVDVGVLYETPPAAQLMAQPFGDEATLAARLQRPVQVVVMNQAPPDLVHRILRDGILLVEANKSRRIAFEVRARNEYFDLLPVLRQYRQRPSA
jgi:predicted nucleotidyltransferase